MDIKEILGEIEGVDVESLAEKINKEIAKSFMPRNKFNEVNEELKATKEQLDNTNSQIEQLSKNSAMTDELKKQLEETQTQYEAFKSDTIKREANNQKKYAIEKGLRAANANPDVIPYMLNDFDLEAINLDKNNNIVDWDDHLNPIKEAKKSLFAEKVVEGTEPKMGTVNAVDPSTLSDTEYFKQKMAQIKN